jgi:hypothetical protein
MRYARCSDSCEGKLGCQFTRDGASICGITTDPDMKKCLKD